METIHFHDTILDVDSEAAEPLQAFHVMTKPRGAICNLYCSYCSFLSKELLYPGSRFRMNELLDSYTHHYISAQRVPEVTVFIAWLTSRARHLYAPPGA